MRRSGTDPNAFTLSMQYVFAKGTIQWELYILADSRRFVSRASANSKIVHLKISRIDDQFSLGQGQDETWVSLRELVEYHRTVPIRVSLLDREGESSVANVYSHALHHSHAHPTQISQGDQMQLQYDCPKDL